MQPRPTITTITGDELPPLWWQHKDRSAAHRAADPAALLAVTEIPLYPKPRGGFWSSPEMEPPHGTSGPWSAWLDWCRSEQYGPTSGYLTRIHPHPGARFLLLDCEGTAAQAFARYPQEPPPLPWPISGKALSWQAMADDGIDGVYLTEAGQAVTRFPTGTRIEVPSEMPGAHHTSYVPDLYGWDCATVWFINHRFTVGETREYAMPKEEGP